MIVGEDLDTRPDASWYAIFTQCNHERRVARQLEHCAIPHFLPVYQQLSHWKDRTVRLERPLFPSYVFVHVNPKQFRQVLQSRGTVYFVGPAGSPLPIPASEIACWQQAIKNYPTEPAEYLQIGERVRIEAGPLRGVTGILSRKMGKTRVLISVETIMRAFKVEIDPSVLCRVDGVPVQATSNPSTVLAA